MSAETFVDPSTRRVPGIGVRGELRASDEQLALEAEDQIGQPDEPGRQSVDARPTVQLGAGKAQRRDGLVDRAVRLGPEIVLLDALAAVEEARGAVVALAAWRRPNQSRACGTPHHHMSPASRGSQRSARSVTFTGCSRTDSACSWTCATIEPA